ncbi:MAG TPA: hypothetical protein VNC84_02050 [Gammaproteobacteria bacterium]|nr:hypothetical protein [Gammaproteobacteria bacterium]
MPSVVGDISASVTEGMRALTDALTAFGSAMNHAAVDVSQYVFETTNVAYHLAGRHTFPISQYYQDAEGDRAGEPPQFRRNLIGNIALFVIPVIPVSILLSITLVPLVGNSIQSFAVGFSSVATAAMSPAFRRDYRSSVFAGNITNDHQHRNFLRRYVYGLPGLLFGMAAAIPLLIATIIVRTITNNIKSFFAAMTEVMYRGSLSSRDGSLSEDLSKRSLFLTFGVGGLGVLLGCAAGAFLVVYAHSVWSWMSTAAYITSLVLEKKHRESVQQSFDDKRLPREKYLFGFPGVVMGAITGALLIVPTLLVRFVINNLRSFWHAFTFMMDRDWGLRDLPKDEEDRGVILTYGIGLPGLLLGGIAGVIGLASINLFRFIKAVLIHSGQTYLHVVWSICNKVLPSYMVQESQQDRPLYQAYGFGIPGALLGAITGMVLVIGIIAARIAANTFTSATDAFLFTLYKLSMVQLTSLPRPENYTPANATGETNHHYREQLFCRYGFGILGLLPGAIAGVLVAAGINFTLLLAIISQNNAKTFADTVKWMSAWVLPEEHQNKAQRTYAHRGIFQQYVLGFPGLVLGVAAGIVSVFGIIAVRILTNNAKSCEYAFKTIAGYEFRMPPIEEASEGSSDKEERSPFLKYGVGCVGLLIGGIAGVIAFAALNIVRFLKTVAINSGLSFLYVARSMAHLVLHSDEKRNLSEIVNNRDRLHTYVLGAPGVLFGMVAGALAMLAIIAVRTLTNNLKSFAAAFECVMRHDLYLLREVDKRPGWRKYGLGLPGLCLGGLVGAVLKVAFHSFLTASTIASGMMYIVLPTCGFARRSNWEPDDRHPVEFYVLGAFGILPGIIIGALSMLAIIMARTLTNNMTSFALSFYSLLALDPSLGVDRYEDDRSNWRKYGWGLPGLLLGGMAGIFVLSVVHFCRVIKHSVLSFRSMSGSMINMALNNGHLFKNSFEHDNRTLKQQLGYGAIGCVVGFVVTLPIACILWARLPLMLTIAIAASPVVFICKLLHRAFGRSAFECHHIGDRDETMQRFKNLFSALSTFGKLPEGIEIPPAGNGKEKLAIFMRKTFLLNIPSLTERLLREMLREYKKNSRNWDKVITTFQTDAVRDLYFADEDDERELRNEIEIVGQFIQRYLEGEVCVKQPDGILYSKNNGSLFRAFRYKNRPVVLDTVSAESERVMAMSGA